MGSRKDRGSSKGAKPFNNPFAKLKLPSAKPAQRPAPPAASTPKEKPHRSAADDEAALFLSAVGQVQPVKKGSPLAASPAPDPDLSRVVDDEVDALAQLTGLVAGEAPLDVADTDEYLEGSVTGLDVRVLRRLRRGDYAVQAHVDLHGLVRADAKEAVERFLRTSWQEGRRCVLIVHGRGLHSKDQQPVLKESVRAWLSRGRASRHVLAFTTARPHDGGAGAVYVLLRR